ncbi:MAG: GAF domain-containing protein [Bacteroidia bacterium]|nr:GAF domain-containing protein [Bacteroidia bacterium]
MLERNNILVRGYLSYFDDRQKSRDTAFLTIFIINLISIVLMVIFILRNVSRPISRLNEMKTIISEGNFDRKIDYRRSDELGEVAKSINSLFENLRNATDFIIAIGEGKLDTEYQRPAETDAQHDRLGTALLEMRDKMSQVAEADRQRNWASEGMAKFAEIFRTHSDSEDFTYIIISNLVKYVDANQGGLFIVEDDRDEDSHLELVAAYAYEKRKYLSRRINKGEGLVGEAYQEGNLIYMTDVPNNYLHITSGLGEANPRSILLIPLKLNDEVYGVVELASFDAFEPYQIDFVERLGESIASTFASVKTSRQTQKLLRESIQLSEQMRAQEEEMRQNLEELVATQEEVQRKNRLIEDQKSELEQTLIEEKRKVELLESQQRGLDMKIQMLQDRIQELENENILIKKQREQWENQV